MSKKTKLKLNDKQKLFVSEYLIDRNAGKAAIRAGYSPKTADAQACRLLKNVKIREAVDAGMDRLEKRNELSQDRVIREYMKIAFLDPRKIFTSTGELLPVSDIDDDSAAALAGVDVVTIGNDYVGIGEVRKVKLVNKLGALDSLARHLGMFNDKLNLNHTFKDMSEDEIDAEIERLEREIR